MARARTIFGVAAAAWLSLAACGDDDDDDATEASALSTAAPAETTAVAPTTGATPTTSGSAPATETSGTETSGSEAGTLPVPDEICALAEQMFEQDDFPSAAQLEKYKELAPEEIADQVNLAADRLLGAGDDLVAVFNAFGEDDVEAAIDEIDAWEEENCGIAHSENSVLPAGAVQEIEDGATRVDVTATDYAFEVGPVEAGRTSFVLTNEGEEAHFLFIVKLAEGVTLEQAMAEEGGEATTEGEWETRVASAGDEEAITFDVEPGNYGLLCFVPAPDGTPHAFMGMQTEITVS